MEEKVKESNKSIDDIDKELKVLEKEMKELKTKIAFETRLSEIEIFF